MTSPNSRTNEKILAIHDLSGGIRSDVNPNQAPPNSATDIVNLFSRDGFLRPRPGLSEVELDNLDLSDATWDDWEFYSFQRFLMYDGSGIARNVLVMYATQTVLPHARKIYYDNGVDGWQDSGVTLTSGLSEGSIPLNGVVFNNKLYLAGPEDDIIIYDRATDTWSDLTTEQPTASLRPDGDIVGVIAKTPTRLFCITHNGSYGVRINWSDHELPLVWNGPSDAAGSSGYQILRDSVNGTVTAIHTIGLLVYVFTREELYIGRPDPNAIYRFDKVYQSIGCTHQNSFVHIESNLCCWVDAAGIYMGRLGEPPQRISDPIERFFKENLPAPTSGGTNDFESIFTRITVFTIYSKSDDCVFFFLRSQNVVVGALTHIFRLSLSNLSWSYGYFPKFRIDYASSSYDYSAGSVEGFNSIFLLGSGATGSGTNPWGDTNQRVTLFSYDNPDDNGTDFDCSYTTKIHHFLELSGGKFQQGDIQKVRVISDGNGEVTLSLIQGNNWDRMTESVMGTQEMDNTGATNPDFYVSGKTREQSEYFQIKIDGSSSTFPRVAGFQISFIDRGDTKQKA